MFSGNNNKKMFCKVCYDAGKPEWEYTSHYVKDQPGPNGKVVCPVILNVECNYCHEKGHTPSHCPKLKERNAFRQQQPQYHHQPPQYHHQQPHQYHHQLPHTPPENPPVYDFHGPRSQPRRTQRKCLDLSTKKSSSPPSEKTTPSFNLKNFYDILEKTMQDSNAKSSRPASPTNEAQQTEFPSLTPTTKPKTTPNSCWGKKMSCEEMTNHLRSLILKHTPKQEAPKQNLKLDTDNIKYENNNENYIDILNESDDNCSEELDLEYTSEDDTPSQSSTNSFVYNKSWADIMDEEEEAGEVFAF